MSNQNNILNRIYVVLLMVVFAAVTIFGRAVYIYSWQGEDLRATANKMQIKWDSTEAYRGNIYAEDGSLLATSLPNYELRFDPTIVDKTVFDDNIDSLAILLNKYVDQKSSAVDHKSRLVNARKNGRRYLLIHKSVSEPELMNIKKFPIFKIGDKNHSGLITLQHNKRQHPFKWLATRTIGKLSVKGQATFGLEGFYDKVLAGEKGGRYMQKDVDDTWVPLYDVSEVEPKPGKDIVSTIDINIQDVAENALLKSLNKFDAEHGCAVVMEVKTGKIKAMANLTRLNNGTYKETRNYAVWESVEPGSTFKLAAILALLNDNYISLTDSVDLEQGKAKFYDEEMIDASYHGLGKATIKKAFEISSNVGIAKLVDKYYNKSNRKTKFSNRLKAFHLDQTTGIDLEGEGEPLIKDAANEDFSGITLPWMSIGYELQLTPLQLLTFYNAVANDGMMMKPHLVSEVRAFGKTVQRINPRMLKRKIAGRSAIRAAKELLEAVVLYGTAQDIRPTDYTIAGKTGTAIMNYKAFKKKLEAKKYRASFAGYFPAEKPLYSCIVMVTDPKTGIYGGVVAAPVFKEIADKCNAASIDSHKAINEEPIAYNNKLLPDLQVGYKADFEKIMKYLKMPYANRSKANWTVAQVRKDSMQLLARNITDKKVPNVVGMGLRDAVYLLENAGLRVNAVGVGKIKSQSIKPGLDPRKWREITLILG